MLHLCGIRNCRLCPFPREKAYDSERSEKKETIVAIAAGNDNFSTLVAAVQAAGLVDVLNGEGPFTVFAPTDAEIGIVFFCLPHPLIQGGFLEACRPIMTFGRKSRFPNKKHITRSIYMVYTIFGIILRTNYSRE